MEIELVAKLVALLVGVLALPKLWQEISERRRGRLKDQLTTAKELATLVDPLANGVVVQSAYAALTGKRPLHPRDIQSLMRLEEPLKAFAVFHMGREFLCRSNKRVLPFRFKDRYRSPKHRKRLLVRFSFFYFGFAILATAPLIFAAQIVGRVTGYTLLGLVAWAVFFGWLAKIALKRFEGLLAAQRLLKLRVASQISSIKSETNPSR